MSAANACQAFSMSIRVLANTTNAITFSIRIGGSAAGTVSCGGITTAQRYGGVGLTTMSVEERIG